MLLPDPLDQAEPQANAPAGGALRDPAVACRRAQGMTQAGERTGRGRARDPRPLRQRLTRIVVMRSVVARDPGQHPAGPAGPFGGGPVRRGVDVDRQHGHAVALGVVDQDLDRVEAHRLGVDQADQELGRVEELEERGFVGGPGERGGVALGEPEAGERGDLAEQLLGDLLGHARLAHAALEELAVELLHLAASTATSPSPAGSRPTPPARSRRPRWRSASPAPGRGSRPSSP